MAHIFIVEARFYTDLANMLAEGATGYLEREGHSFEQVEVPGALEIPPAIAMAADTKKFDGFIALGCVIRGETYHFEVVCNESARGIMNLAIGERLAIGNGILTVESRRQAVERADPRRGNKGAGAAQACLDLIALKQQLPQSRNVA